MVNSFKKDLFNVPNTISIFRLLTAPFIMIFWLGLDMPIVALSLGFFTGISDLFDGILARKLNQITELGALLDQLGDLIFESIALLLAVILGELWIGFLVIYLFREFTVTVMRTFVYSNGGTLPSSWIGKAKSAYIQWALFILFLGNILKGDNMLPDSWVIIGITPGELLVYGALTSIYVGLFAGLFSAAQYLKSFVNFYEKELDNS